jgi:putative membrane protein
MSKKKETEKTLILCVDRDNDIGVKGEIQSPIIGRKRNIEAASKLALKDPEEADANAVFGAVRTYDALSKEKGEGVYEVATITGSELGGVKADKNLVTQLKEVLGEFPAKNVVLVTDGFADEEVIPIIQSYVPIMSVRRIVVRHSETIEESWALFSRYLRKLAEDPYYSRIALGVPGILLVALAVLWIFNYLLYAGYTFLIIIGSVLLIKGFGIDKRIASVSIPNPLELIKLFTMITAIVILGVDAYQTFSSVAPHVPSDSSLWWSSLPRIAGLVTANAVDLITVALSILLIGRAIFYYFTHNRRIWRNGVGIVVLIWVREVALRASSILLAPVPPTSISDRLIIDLLFSAGLGIAGTLIAVLVTMSLSRRYKHYFGSEGEEGTEKA